MPCRGILHLFQLDGLPDPPTIHAWRLLDAQDEEEERTWRWHPVYSISVDIWPVLTSQRDTVVFGLVDPLHATVIYLFCGELLVAVDLRQGDVLQSEIFFPDAPHRIHSSIAAKLSKKMVRKLRKSLKQVAKYVIEHPECLIIAGTAMEAYAVAYIPHRMKTRAGATYLGKAISGSGKAIKWSSSGAEWLRQVAEVQEQELSGCVYDLVTVNTSSQAEDVIASWVASGNPCINSGYSSLRASIIVDCKQAE